MKKIETIWREILDTGINNPVFQQQTLAKKFGFSTSTVFAALKPLREIGAVSVTGRNFRLVNFEKLLYFWATHRSLAKDITYQTRVNESVTEIEGLMPAGAIYGAYSAARRWLPSPPADYDKVYVYAPAETIAARFPKLSGQPNLFVLKPDPFLKGPLSPVSQTFVDLWNLPDWYATDFLQALKDKFYGFL